MKDRVITLRVAGWGLLLVGLLVLAAGGIVGLVTAAVAIGFGLYCLTISRERRRARTPNPGGVQSRLEKSLLVGPWAESWYHRQASVRAVEKQRHRWRWWVLVAAVAVVSVSVPYGLASGYGSGFGYHTADLTTETALKALVLFVVVTAGLWGGRRLAANRLPVLGRPVRFAVRTVGFGVFVAGLVGPAVIGVRAAGEWTPVGATRPTMVGMVEVLSDVPKVRVGSVRAATRAELRADPNTAGFNNTDLDALLDEVAVVADHDLLILGTNTAGNLVVFDRTTQEPFELHPATFRPD